MTEIGVRDLKSRASEIVREVKERRRRYVVTHRGRPAALLVPLEEPTAAALAPCEGGVDAWEELLRLGEEIGRGWISPQSSADLLSSMRR